jgi:AraC-like DNA-binding protein
VKKKFHTIWRGFEIEPQGVLLNQYIDINGDMGVAYERSHTFYKDFHTHDRPIFIFPRASCKMTVHVRPQNKAYSIDIGNCLMVPAHIEHDDKGITPIYDTFALLPSEKLIQSVLDRKGVDTLPPHFFKEVQEILRSEWLARLTEEYFFEKLVAHRLGEESLRFFEEHILIEIFRIASGSNRQTQAATPSENLDHKSDDPIISRALRFIEGNLFDELTLKEISAKSHSSESTLQRRFREALGYTPMDYVRVRRLEEAANLLTKGSNTVTDIALIIGYNNAGAFSEAFRLQYGESPSQYQKKLGK